MYRVVVLVVWCLLFVLACQERETAAGEEKPAGPIGIPAAHQASDSKHQTPDFETPRQVEAPEQLELGPSEVVFDLRWDMSPDEVESVLAKFGFRVERAKSRMSFWLKFEREGVEGTVYYDNTWSLITNIQLRRNALEGGEGAALSILERVRDEHGESEEQSSYREMTWRNDEITCEISLFQQDKGDVSATMAYTSRMTDTRWKNKSEAPLSPGFAGVKGEDRIAIGTSFEASREAVENAGGSFAEDIENEKHRASMANGPLAGFSDRLYLATLNGQTYELTFDIIQRDRSGDPRIPDTLIGMKWRSLYETLADALSALEARYGEPAEESRGTHYGWTIPSGPMSFSVYHDLPEDTWSVTEIYQPR